MTDEMAPGPASIGMPRGTIPASSFVEKLRYIHRNPVVRGLVARPEDWKWSSYRHYQTGLRGTVEIESEWTARHRGWQLPGWMRYRQLDSSSPVPKSEGPGAPSA
jgi:hypothetical protein